MKGKSDLYKCNHPCQDISTAFTLLQVVPYALHHLILLVPSEEGIIYDALYLLPYFTDSTRQASDTKLFVESHAVSEALS